MAHAMQEARSILCVRATRSAKVVVSSNIVWSYGHVTVPRHLRDIAVTEYGIADLRGRTDREVVEALVGIMDSRFQQTFVNDAKRAGKLPKDWVVPEAARANTPEHLSNKLAPWRQRGLFPELPFGTDFTAEEIALAKALRSLQAATQSWPGRVRAVVEALMHGSATPAVQPHLARMGLERADSLSQTVQRRLLTAALRKILHSR
jgi:hypothetical protein